MKLYFSKGACSLVIRILINELNIPCEYEAVNLKTKQTVEGADFLKINSKGAVPTLITDKQETLTENSVIQQYLVDTHKASQLLPPIGDFKRYRVLEWLNFISTDLHKGCGPLFSADVPEDIKASIFRPLLKKKFQYVENQLGNKSYLVGDTYTLPDGYLFVLLTWFKGLKLDLTDFPNLTRYFNELKNRKSIQQALKEEELAFSA